MLHGHTTQPYNRAPVILLCASAFKRDTPPYNTAVLYGRVTWLQYGCNIGDVFHRCYNRVLQPYSPAVQCPCCGGNCWMNQNGDVKSSLFKLRAWQSFCTTSVHVLFGLPLGLKPSTSYSIHFFTQSVSSFRNTCPYHRNLFCCSTKIILSFPSRCLNSLLGTLSFMIHRNLINHMCSADWLRVQNLPFTSKTSTNLTQYLWYNNINILLISY